jgi:hypothetical protein
VELEEDLEKFGPQPCKTEEDSTSKSTEINTSQSAFSSMVQLNTSL